VGNSESFGYRATFAQTQNVAATTPNIPLVSGSAARDVAPDAILGRLAPSVNLVASGRKVASEKRSERERHRGKEK
jgi:hypothetical protein